ncbi:MAG TPA: nicotinate-nucleotide adenylyltransferase [Burkholderiales bacterium]|nr:nicotinate-nucleotide adenylyltransferase [Burkholderiales bacterium]
MATLPGPVGILGGTFDPVHYAHLRLAEEVADALDLAQVRFVPASIPPHRASPQVSATHRADMVRLACADNARFALDDRECRRAGPSYTVDTLLELRAELGSACSLCLLMGLDAFLGLTTWSRWERLFELAHIVIAHRPGFALDPAAVPAALARELDARRAQSTRELRQSWAGLVWLQAITPLDISATAIREAIRERRSPRYLLPDSVLDYIHRSSLYKDLDAG